MDARKNSAYDCVLCGDYYKHCNTGMVPIFVL